MTATVPRPGPAPIGRLPAVEPTPAVRRADPTGLPGLASGLAGVFRGLAFTLARPRLLVLVLLPAALNVLLLVALLVLAWDAAPSVTPALEDRWHGLVDWARGPSRFVLVLFARAAGVVLALAASLALAGVVNAPFYEVLSARAEAAAGGPARPGGGVDLLRSIRASLFLLAVEAVVLGPLVVAGLFLPLAPLALPVAAWFGGLSLSDASLARRGLGGRERLAWGRKRWGLLVGLGLPVAFAPVLAPFGVVGASLRVLSTDAPSPQPVRTEPDPAPTT
jgi:uncharacterized protein involved in cysteine biosynthesis